MVYLDKEDIYIPATYKGAPKVCYQCRVAGHMRQECPELANVQCYNCKAYGHLRRHWKKETNDCSENEEGVEYQNLEEYIEECVEARIRAAMEGEPDSEMETDSTAED
jgi:Zinc knuckle